MSAVASVNAQEAAVDTSWKTGGIVGLNFTQVSLSNWAAGGQNSISGIALFNYYANYNKGKNIWDNTIDLGYGLTQNGDADPIKSEDKIDLSSKYGRYAFKHWYYSAMVGFKSQFTPGYNYPNDSVKISNFMAPAYITVALGMDYKPNDNFSLFISPAAMKLTMVNDKKLFNGIPDDGRVFGVKNGSTTEVEVGGYIRAQYQKNITKNFTFLTRGDLYSNYLRNPQNMDVTWETLWTLKVNSWFAATLNTLLLYDHDIDVPKVKEVVNGIPVPGTPGPGAQFKETLGIGLTFAL